MASGEMIAKSVCDELGILQPKDVDAAVRYAGEAALDILSERHGRFLELKKTAFITIPANTRVATLPGDFNTPFFVAAVDANDVPIHKYGVPGIFEFIDRQEQGKEGTFFGYFDNPEGSTYKFYSFNKVAADKRLRLDYFRFPTSQDANLVRNESTIKHYIRAQFGNIISPQRASVELQMYFNSKQTYGDRAIPMVIDRIVKPSRKIQRQNLKAWEAGKIR